MTRAKALKDYFKKFYDIDAEGMTAVDVTQDFLKKKYDYDSEAATYTGVIQEIVDNELSPGEGGGGNTYPVLFSHNILKSDVLENHESHSGNNVVFWTVDLGDVVGINNGDYIAVLQEEEGDRFYDLFKINDGEARIQGTFIESINVFEGKVYAVTQMETNDESLAEYITNFRVDSIPIAILSAHTN